MTNFLVSLLGILIFLFIFWRRLKEDYHSQIIFSSSFYILLGFALGHFISLQFFKPWFFWADLVGIILGLGVSFLRFKTRFYELLEAAVISLMPAVSLLFLKDSVVNSSLVSFIAFLVILFLIFVFFLIDAHYREFSWYRSGKIGFSGLATLGLFFLIRGGVAIFFTSVLSFVGKSEVTVGGILALLSFLLIFNLGRQ